MDSSVRRPAQDRGDPAELEHWFVGRLRVHRDALAKARSDADRALARARIQLGVLDAKWDTTVASFGRNVVDVAGGQRGVPDYLRFFGKASPSAVQDFGIQREIDSARAWLVELARDPNQPLSQTWTPKLKTATDELEMALNRRRDCQRAIEPLQTAVLLLIDDVNHELNRLEGDLKKLFPMDAARVASYLSATRASRTVAPDEPAPAPAPVPVPVAAAAAAAK